MKRTAIHLSIILLFLSGLFFSCEKEIRSSIPDFEVFIETSPSEFAMLQTIMIPVTYTPDKPVSATFRLGYGGVLIFRDFDKKVRSFDLACPVEVSRNTRVEIDMPFAVCPVCNSKFDLSWGFASPVAGPAKEPLRAYRNVFERANSYVVQN